jgi:hypothetical protein
VPSAAPPTPDAGSVRRPRLSPTAVLSLGLLLTLLGLFVLGGSVPTAPGPLERAVAVTGVGAVALWVGGVLLGRAGHR